MAYTIKQVAAKTNLKPHVLRYYEREGLLPSVQRSEGGIRLYTADDLEWLGLITCLKNTGMSIKQIREFVELSLAGDETLPQRCQLLQEHRQTVEEQIQEMQRHLSKVIHKIDHFSRQYQQSQAGQVAEGTEAVASAGATGYQRRLE